MFKLKWKNSELGGKIQNWPPSGHSPNFHLLQRPRWPLVAPRLTVRPCSVDSLDGRATDVPILGPMEIKN